MRKSMPWALPAGVALALLMVFLSKALLLEQEPHSPIIQDQALSREFVNAPSAELVQVNEYLLPRHDGGGPNTLTAYGPMIYYSVMYSHPYAQNAHTVEIHALNRNTGERALLHTHHYPGLEVNISSIRATSDHLVWTLNTSDELSRLVVMSLSTGAMETVGSTIEAGSSLPHVISAAEGYISWYEARHFEGKMRVALMLHDMHAGETVLLNDNVHLFSQYTRAHILGDIVSYVSLEEELVVVAAHNLATQDDYRFSPEIRGLAIQTVISDERVTIGLIGSMHRPGGEVLVHDRHKGESFVIDIESAFSLSYCSNYLFVVAQNEKQVVCYDLAHGRRAVIETPSIYITQFLASHITSDGKFVALSYTESGIMCVIIENN